MSKPDLPHHKRWMLWEVPNKRGKTVPAFDAEDGWSLQKLDNYVFGDNLHRLELCVVYVREAPQIQVVVGRGFHTADKIVATTPLPETLEETVAWARMVARLHTADHDPRDDGNPFV